MKTENLDHIRNLRASAKGMRTFFDAFNKCTSDPKCDKHKAAFNNDSRFSLFKVELSFDAYVGYYGNSGCTTFGNGVSGSVASKAIAKAIENNKRALFQEAADIMEERARELIEDAEMEIEGMQKMLEGAKNS